MPHLVPFPGLRPTPALTGPLDDVICPPYDIITPEQREALVARSPYNVVRVELPDGDYERAAALLREWSQEGAFATDPEPALYGYRMTYDLPDGSQHQTLGVLGALALEPPGQGILPHEQTTPKAKSDRLELIRATGVNTSPIWCLCSQPGLTEALGPVPPAGTALCAARDDEGTLHEIWPVVSAERHADMDGVISAAPLLVADGHHRYETALAYQAERGHGTGADFVLSLVVELSEEHLAVLAIHRAISGLPAGYDLPGALTSHFELYPTRAEEGQLLKEMVEIGGLGLVTREQTWVLVPRPQGVVSTQELDSSRIDAALSTLPEHTLVYEHEVAQASEDVRSGNLDAVVFCRPATVSQIAETARGGQRMPPKTTFFWPKPRTGMVFRQL